MYRNGNQFHKIIYLQNGNRTHFDGECSKVLSSHLDYLSEVEYGAVAI